MNLQSMLNDTVSLIKQDGSRTDNIRASVQRDRIITFNSEIPIEEGDVYERSLPSGYKERYVILDSGYRSGAMGMPPSYQSIVRKQTKAEEQESMENQLRHILTEKAFPRVPKESDVDEYDSLTDDVMSANYTNHAYTLKRWFYYLDNHASFSLIVKRLTSAVDFDKWYEDGRKTMTGMAGSGTLEWPLNTENRLGLQLSLFRSFAEEQIHIGDFCSDFMYTGSRYEDMVHEVNDQYFRVMARDLRRLLIKAPVTPVSPVSTTERFIVLSNNPEDHARLINLMTDLISKIESNNEFRGKEPEAQERAIAELKASKELISAKTVSSRALTYVSESIAALISKFSDGIIGQIAGEVYKAIKSHMGLG